MRFYRLVGNSPLPRLVGNLVIGRPFAALTVALWICVPETSIAPQVLAHEKVHVAQFWVGWVIGLALWTLFTPGWWWLVATPLAFPLAYLLASLVAWARGGHAYRGNFFEQQARYHAGET